MYGVKSSSVVKVVIQVVSSMSCVKVARKDHHPGLKVVSLSSVPTVPRLRMDVSVEGALSISIALTNSQSPSTLRGFRSFLPQVKRDEFDLIVPVVCVFRVRT